MQNSHQATSHSTQAAGIQVSHCDLSACFAFFEAHGIEEGLDLTSSSGALLCRMSDAWMQLHVPASDTLSLHLHAKDLKQEILWAMLVSPHRFEFNDLEALSSAVRVRENIVLDARKTALAFKTNAAERPSEFWRYEEEAGFILQPHTPLIEALISATQPEATGKLYDFSCYRASEYVILLGLAQEARQHNPSLLAQLQQVNEKHAIRSGLFHEVFLHEYGSLEAPLPAGFYVPGDRVWFRNPDARSSDVTGYEGSWVIYVGSGLFSNFWKRDQPFTLQSKCIEIYHWRDGVQVNVAGDLWMDETIVDACVLETMQDPDKVQHVLRQMMRIRDPKDVYAEGGCLDATRESPKQIFPTATELVLPKY
jgi:hypothetical protein